MVDVEQLQTISSHPKKEGSSWVKSPDFTQLGRILDTIVTITCQAPALVTSGSKCNLYGAFHSPLEGTCHLVQYEYHVVDIPTVGSVVGKEKVHNTG